jgi:dTDP-4-dehydrorhamnose reductase
MRTEGKGKKPRLLLTGGSGRLGTELRRLCPALYAPTRAELDITSRASVERTFAAFDPEVVVHAAAYTDVAAAERERERCWRVNVEGTRHVARAVREHGAVLVHISTDYVFWGDVGNYREDDPPGPTRNYYALSKLVAEESVRSLAIHLVIRTSFRPTAWPYAVAFTDLYTSQDYVDAIAPEIALAIHKLEQIPFDTLHIATERKSAFELARRRKPDVKPGSKADAGVALPDDISLDVSRWQALKRRWQGGD